MPDLPKTLWDASEFEQSQMGAFVKWLSEKRGIQFSNYDHLHQWSVAKPNEFWSDIWDFCGVIGDKGTKVFEDIDVPPYGRFFSDSKISYAENILRHAKDKWNDKAIIVRHEGEADKEQHTTYGELYEMVSKFEQALRDIGVQEGDAVAAYLPNIAEADGLLLAASNLGAIFVSADMDTGEQSLLDRFEDIQPKVLFAGDGYRFRGKTIERAELITSLQSKLPSLEKTVIVPTLHYDEEAKMDGFNPDKTVSLKDFTAQYDPQEINFIRRDFNHPIFILFSSGSTGKPKQFVHSTGGILIEMMCERPLHNDLRPGDVDFQHSKTTWMMWNFQNAALACGATLLKHTGDSFYPGLDAQWDFVSKHGVTHFGSAAPLIIKWMEADLNLGEMHDLSKLRFISSTGSVLPESGFHYAHEKISSSMKIVSFSGGSDKCACCLGGNPWTPTRAGYIDGPTLGHKLSVLNDEGDIAPIGEAGELCFMNPTPSAPLRFYGDDDTFSLYKEAYYESYMDILDQPVWRHGDLTESTPSGGFIIHGRSDTTLNQYGVRFGTHVIYKELKQFNDEIKGATAVNYTKPTDKQQVAVLLLHVDNHEDGIPQDLETRIKRSIKENEGPNYVPAHIFAVPGVLTTLSGKNAEKITSKALQGIEIANPNDYGANGTRLIEHLRDIGASLDQSYEIKAQQKKATQTAN